MLPPPPPTDPDVPNCGIRFFTLELRSGRRTYMPSVTCWSRTMHNATSHRRLANSAIHCRFVHRWMWLKVLMPVSRQWVSMPRRPPSLGRVLPSTVPQRRQYYEGATTPRTAYPLAHWVRAQAPTPTSCLRSRRSAPARPEAPHGPGPWSAGWSLPAPVAWTMRDLPGSLTIRPVPLPSSRTPVGPTPPGHQGGGADAAPAARTTKAPAIRAISGLTTGLRHLLSTLQEYRCRYPGKTRFRPAGSRLYRVGVEPTGSLRKVSGHSHGLPPSQGFTLALPRCARDDSRCQR